MSRLYTFVAAVIAALLIQAGSVRAEGEAAADAAGKSKAPKASFFLIGGAADQVLADFVKLAGGDKANIAIITHASATPAETGDDLQNTFTALGVKRSTVILPSSKVGLPKDANAVYICGGDQSRLKRLLDDPLLDQLQTFE